MGTISKGNNMKVESKFNIGDKVYSVSSSIYVHIIKRITTTSWQPSDKEGLSTDYSYDVSKVPGVDNAETSSYTGIGQHRLYSTKQAAGEAWMKRNGLDCGMSET